MRPRHGRFGLNILPSASCNFSFYFSVVTVGPYRVDRADSPGGKSEECTVRTSAPCRQYPFERPAGGLLQAPERQKENRQFGGFA
mgnify:CR=1 FL=1